MTQRTIDLVDLLRRLAARELQAAPNTPTARLSAEFFRHNWENVQPLLASTTRLRLRPQSASARTFDFELDVPFKRQRHPAAPIDVAPGPIRGSIVYRADVYTAGDEPVVGVLIDPTQGLLHANYSRLHGVLCLGHLPAGPFPLDALLEHLYTILTYQNLSLVDPADADAANYFASDPHARDGIPAAAPLWGGSPAQGARSLPRHGGEP